MSARRQLPPEPGARLRLPELRDASEPEGRFASRAVRYTLYLLAALVLVGGVAASTIPVKITVRATGVLEPVRVWPVRTLESGLISRVLVRTGSVVAAGQTLIQLDTLDLGAALATTDAQYRTGDLGSHKAAADGPLEESQHEQELARARTRVVAARATLRLRLVDNGFGHDTDSLLAVYRMGTHVVLDQAVADLYSAQSEVRLAREQIERTRLKHYDRSANDVAQRRLTVQMATIRERMRRLAVSSPIAGIVLTEQIEKLPGSAVAPGQMLLEVADTAQWQVALLVAENDVHTVQIGDSVKIQVEAFRAEDRGVLQGTVAYVASSPAGGAAGDEQGGKLPGERYRVVVALEPRQVATLGVQELRRGYFVDGRVIARSGTIVELLRQWWAEHARFELPW